MGHAYVCETSLLLGEHFFLPCLGLGFQLLTTFPYLAFKHFLYLPLLQLIYVCLVSGAIKLC